METTFHLISSNVHQLFVALRELHEVRVTVDKVVYVPTLDAPEDRPYPFVYFITIDNQSPHAVTIRGRKWVISDDRGQKVVVEGDGVVGEHPHLKPGERFSYNSYHVIGVHSVAEGSFLGMSDDGKPFVTRIPRFEMSVPAEEA
ncbi:MAG TPA: ApaG domain [Chthoniobacterales bacterium]